MPPKKHKKFSASAKKKQELEKFKKANVANITTEYHHHAGTTSQSIPRIYTVIIHDKHGNQACGIAIMAEMDYLFCSEVLASPAEPTALPTALPIASKLLYLDSVRNQSFQMAHGRALKALRLRKHYSPIRRADAFETIYKCNKYKELIRHVY